MQRRDRAQPLARIRVVGIGGGGRTAVNSMLATGIFGVDFLTIDTDEISRQESRAPLNLQIGRGMVGRRGAAGLPERGKQAAQESKETIQNALHGSDLVFIIAGLGGGTGSGAAPLVAQVAKEHGAVTIGIVTYPFGFEGEQRANAARQGITWLRNWTDTLIVIPNDRLLKMADGSLGFHETYRLAHDIWQQSVQGISELLSSSGLINVDFADVQSIMSEGGGAIIATGRGSGQDRARIAAEKATRSELLGIAIDGAMGVLFNICGSKDMGLLEVERAAEIITRRVHPNANVIFGAAINPELEDEISITVIATGFAYNTSKSGEQIETTVTNNRVDLNPSQKIAPTPLITIRGQNFRLR